MKTGSKNNLERREFLTQSCVAGTASVIGLPGITHVLAANQDAISDLKSAHFDRMIGQKFTVSTPNKNVGLKLVQVHNYKYHDSRPEHVRQEGFSVLLAGSRQDELPPATYQVHNPDIGTLELFLHEVGFNGDSSSATYEVVFN